jgi:perosamine synthetase
MFFPPLPRQRLYTRLSTYASILRDIVSGRVHDGTDVTRLEEQLGTEVGVSYALAVNQCRLGIYLALKSFVTEEKPKVILSPFTIFDIVNMVLCAGGRPVFADVRRDSCTIDPNEVERLIDDETAAVLVTHTHVMCSGIDRIAEICRGRGVGLVEDAAVAFGTRYNGRAVGTLGDIGVYSFGLFKNISALYGGMVVTRSEELYRRMAREAATFDPVSPTALGKKILQASYIDFATLPLIFRTLTFWVFRYGFLHKVEPINKRTRNDPNPTLRRELPDSLRKRISPAQARLIRSQLERVRRDMNDRIRTAEYYHRGLEGLPEVILPPLANDGSNGYLVFPIQVEERDALLRHMMVMGRDCASYYYRNCADLDIFSEFARDCPNARLAGQKTVLMPTYPRYNLKEAAKNVGAVRDFFEGRRRA